MTDCVKFLFDGVLGNFLSALIVGVFIWYLTTQLNSIKNKAKYLSKKHRSIIYRYRLFMSHKTDYVFTIPMEESLDRDLLCDELRKRGFNSFVLRKSDVDVHPSQELIDKLFNAFIRECRLLPIKSLLKKFWTTIFLFVSVIFAIISSILYG